MSENLVLPVLPLREIVLFPGASIPIAAGRPGTLKAIEAALATADRLVFAVAQRVDQEEVSPSNLYTVGTIASVGAIQRGMGSARLLLQGQTRGIAMRLSEKGGMLEAAVLPARDMPPLDLNDPASVALQKELRERSADLGKKLGIPDEVVSQVLSEAVEPGTLADIVAAYIDIPVIERQKLLETLGIEDRVRRTLVHVQRLISVLEAQEDIKSKVQQEISGRQKEMFLREQLKAIQKELGEGEFGGDDAHLKELKAKLDALELPDEARKEVEREWSRLKRLQGESMEAGVIRTFLETLAELPWSRRSEDHLDVVEAARILEEDHYGLPDVKDRVLEFLAVRQLIAEREAPGQERAKEAAALPGKGKILLFIGPPGVGKTSIAKSIARAMGRKYVRISLGGARDEADIRGHRRTYVGAMPGRILQGMKQAGTKNPVFLLDEIDKLGVSFQGDPASALLEVLDPAQNDTFTDHYLGIPFDLSEVLFVATANFMQGIPAPLLDRLETVEFTGYTEEEKREIARRYLLPRVLSGNGLSRENLELSDDALAAVISEYTREAGVRQLERSLDKLARKVARKIAAKEVSALLVTPADVETLLGRKKVHPEQKIPADQVGIATGMYYTPAGGDIMFVEAALMPGKGDLVLTGQMGDVMKESARAAWTFARVHADKLGIHDQAFERDVHIHVPAGAVPKDGPSAGIAMATAIVSALSRKPARHDTAMTGEITLSGRVLPIGGVKEKVLGAVRAGITTVVLPKENEVDLEDLPESVRSRLTVHTVTQLEEAMSLTIRGAEYREGHLRLLPVQPSDSSTAH